MEAALFAELKLWLVALLYATARIQLALIIIPLFSKQLMPGLIRTAIGVSLSLVLMPPLHAPLAGSMPDTLTMALTVLKEAVIGALIGYAVSILFWAIEAVGFFIDNQRGASIASTLDPLTGHDSSPLGLMFSQAFIVYFLVAGGMPLFLGLVYKSYAAWPVTSFFPKFGPEGITIFAGFFVNLLLLALLLSAPVIVAMLLAELGLALVSRFTPQLQVFFLAMPIKSGLAFFVLVVYLPTMLEYIRDELGRMPALMELLGQALR